MERKAEESWKIKLPTKSKEYKSGGTLRDYQVEGLSWLLSCWYSKRSSILADEMGLGKTVQVVTFLDHLFEVESIKGITLKFIYVNFYLNAINRSIPCLCSFVYYWTLEKRIRSLEPYDCMFIS